MAHTRPAYADLDRTRVLIENSGFDAVIATWPENTGHLSGFYHPDARVNWERLHVVVWPASGAPAFVVPRMRAQLWGQAGDAPFIGPEDNDPLIEDVRGFDGEDLDMVRIVAEILIERGADRGLVGLEMRVVPAKVVLELQRLLPAARFGDAWGLFNEIRKVKTPAELEVITRANQVTAAALEQVLATVRPGQTEREIAAELAHKLWAAGADELSHSVLGVGPRASSWHPWPAGQTLEEGSLIRTDWGIRIDGYTSDIARNAVVGKASAAQRDTFSRLSDAHDAVVAAIYPGILASELSAFARHAYRDVGLEFRWGLIGHGIGMVIHEEPQLLLDVHDPIVEGMTLEIELGYFSDAGGFHIEDLVHVDAVGATTLTQSPGRALIESSW